MAGITKVGGAGTTRVGGGGTTKVSPVVASGGTVTFDGVSAAMSVVGAVGSITFTTHTVGTLVNGYLIVPVTLIDNTSPSRTATATCDGSAMTALITGTPNGVTNAGREYLFGFTAPGSGTHSIVVTASGSVTNNIAACSISHGHVLSVDHAVSNPGNSGSPTSGAVVSQTNNMVVSWCSLGSALSAWAPTDRLHANTSGGAGNGNNGLSTAPGAATVTLNWTGGSDFNDVLSVDLVHD